MDGWASLVAESIQDLVTLTKHQVCVNALNSARPRICRQARRDAVWCTDGRSAHPACDEAERDLPRHGRTDSAVPPFDHEGVQHRALAGIGWTGDGRAGSFPCAVTLPEGVRPVNVVSMWVLPSSSRTGY
jgi:hypothetical protein